VYIDSVRAKFSFNCAHALTVAAVGGGSKPSMSEMLRINLCYARAESSGYSGYVLGELFERMAEEQQLD
jgi:hypothetical protein